jgi:tetratricopeptide (TPR) repeat protein
VAEKEVEALEAEFRRAGPDLAVALSARAALRAVPALTFLLNRQRQFKSGISAGRYVLPVFRALHCSWLAAVAEPGVLNPTWIHNAAEAAESLAKAVGSDGRNAIFVPAYAAYAAAGNNPAYTAAAAIVNAPRANSFAAFSTAFPRGRQQTADRVEERTREAGVMDLYALRDGLDPRMLARQPLWTTPKELAWTRNAWGWLGNALHTSGEDWYVWIAWYEARLEGQSFNEQLELAVAALTNDFQSKGTRFVNAQIKSLFDKHEPQEGRNTEAKRPDLEINDAQTLHNSGRLEEALRAYESTIERFPASVPAYVGRAEVLRQMGRIDEALRAYEGAIESFPTNVIAYTGHAEVLREMGQIEEALSAYESAIELFPRNVVVYTGRAETLRAMGRIEEALRAYESVLELFPHDVIARAGHAEALRAMGRFEEALRAYDSAVEAFPDDVVVSNGRAELLREMGSAQQVVDPPSPEAIPRPERRAVQFGGNTNGPIDLAAVSSPGERLEDDAGRREDYAEMRAKALVLRSLGTNRLGHLHAPVERFLSLPDEIQQVRSRLFWSRINSLRVTLDSHEQAAAQSVEHDERRLESSVAPLLQDLVETINVFMIGDPVLMDLDAARPGPQEIVVAKDEVAVLTPMLSEAITNPDVATEPAREILKEQIDNLQDVTESLHERQAADFGRRTVRNFVSEVLRRAYAPVRELAKSESAFAWKGIREGAYRTIGTGVLTGLVTDLSGVTSFHKTLIQFVGRHAETLSAYVMKAYQNPTLVEIINWISRLGS